MLLGTGFDARQLLPKDLQRFSHSAVRQKRISWVWGVVGALHDPRKAGTVVSGWEHKVSFCSLVAGRGQEKQRSRPPESA